MTNRKKIKIRRTSTHHQSPAPTDAAYKVNIKVFGVGGGGGNAITRMYENIGIRGVDFIAINTDSQDLEKTNVRHKIHIGKNLTRGLGTGMNPDLGRQAAEENRSEIVEAVKGADLVFVTAGLGGGTGSGASPLVADVAREQGALTIAIVTKPFTFEGSQRMRVADEALARLREKVDAIIVVPNDRIFNIIKKDTPILKAFERIDDILHDTIGGIAELIASAGIINVDFADIKAIMKDAGSALVGVGIASGATRAAVATNLAMNSPLLEFSIEGARGILFGISGGRDIKMTEVNEIAKSITATVDPSAKIIFGTYYDRKMKKGNIKITLIATGFNGAPSGNSLKTLQNDALPSTTLFTSTNQGARKKEVTKTESQPQPTIGSYEDIIKEPVSKKLIKDDKKAVKQPVEKKSDIWDIPAFLRKRKRQ
ncbi:MAG: cell division protein FtsZ [bacterium]|nr:cell division protein FtsZ [bacterium]